MEGRGLYHKKHRATGTSKSCSSSNTVSASFEDLPYEIIVNILSRTSVKSVLRCRCVSKNWCNIIDDPRLNNMHILNCAAAAAEKHDIVLVSNHTRLDKTRLFSLKDDSNILRASDYPIVELLNAHGYHLAAINLGIIIFRSTYPEGQSILLNLSRGEVLTLPPATVLASPFLMVLDHYGFGFDNTTNTYKVVRIFPWRDVIDPEDYVSEIYTLGTKSWRKISSVLPYHVEEMPISAYGDIHWMINGDTPEGSAESMIITFDFKTQEFKLTPHPDFQCKKYDYFHLVDVRGSLAILDLSPTTHMEIWVLKDYERKEWAQEYRINNKLLLREGQLYSGEPYFMPDIIRVVGAWEEGLLFEVETSRKEFYYCNIKTGSLRCIKCITPTSAASTQHCIYNFTRSLVSLRNHGNF